MLFKQYLSIPPNTPMLTPVKAQLSVLKGTITQWLIYSDPEAADLLHFKCSYHGSQLIPFRGGEWVEGFLQPITLTENIELSSPPFVIDVEGYNEDDTFRHEFYMHINIVKHKPIELPGPSEGAIDKFKKLFYGGD